MQLSENQKHFLDIVLTGRNVFLTGKAGTGKSFIVKQAIEELTKDGKNVVAIAPTGIADRMDRFAEWLEDNVYGKDDVDVLFDDRKIEKGEWVMIATEITYTTAQLRSIYLETVK